MALSPRQITEIGGPLRVLLRTHPPCAGWHCARSSAEFEVAFRLLACSLDVTSILLSQTFIRDMVVEALDWCRAGRLICTAYSLVSTSSVCPDASTALLSPLPVQCETWTFPSPLHQSVKALSKTAPSHQPLRSESEEDATVA